MIDLFTFLDTHYAFMFISMISYQLAYVDIVFPEIGDL
jgi:hypothetical protein